MTILSLELAARYGAYLALLGRNFWYLVKEYFASCCVKSQSNTEKKKWKFDFVNKKEITRFAGTPWMRTACCAHNGDEDLGTKKAKGRETGP